MSYPIPKWEIADAASLQACVDGTATPDQQKRAIRYIIESLSDYYELSYSDKGTDRDTNFHEGRRFVGKQVVALIKTNLTAVEAAEKLKQQRKKEKKNA